jgi:hypothetical protein
MRHLTCAGYVDVFTAGSAASGGSAGGGGLGETSSGRVPSVSFDPEDLEAFARAASRRLGFEEDTLFRGNSCFMICQDELCTPSLHPNKVI